MARGASPVRHEGGQKLRLKVFGQELPDVETDEQFQAHWKISKAREEALLLDFAQEVKAAGLLRPEHDKYYLRRFLRARQHDLARAKAMFAEHCAWRKEFGVDDIVANFRFHERDAFLSLYPQGYHKTDKLGRPVYIQHLGAINLRKLSEITSEERMLKFHVQEYERCVRYIMPACSRVAGRHIEQTFAIIDVTGVGLSHFTGQVKGLLSKITSVDQNNYPEMMGKTVIINAPGMFKMVWGMVKRFLDARTLAKIELHGANYQATLLKHIPAENLPEYLGGSSKATLLDDAGPWQDPALLAAIDADYRAGAGDGLPLAADSTTPGAASTPGGFRDGSEAGGAAGEAPARQASPPRRRLSLRPGRRPPANGEATEESPGQAWHDSLELPARASCAGYASEDDLAYYSPRSDSSFSTSASERSQARLAPEPEAAHPLLEAEDAARRQGSGSKARSLAARVRRLEQVVPGLRARLQPGVELRRGSAGSFTRGGGGNMMGRVEQLEDAVEALLALEEEKAHDAKRAAEDKAAGGCLCCSIM